MGAPLLGHIMAAVAVEDDNAPEAIDHKGNKVIDKASRITERIPLIEDIDEHMPFHLPFRAWCPHCVAGKGVSGHHITSSKADRIGIAISMDFCFLGLAEKDG